MADKTGIQWTDATWNPVVGCSVVSPGCTNCYAMKMAERIQHMNKDDAGLPGGHYSGTTKVVNGNPVWTGQVAFAPQHILTAPLRWKRPRRIFVNSMGDLFHESVPDAWIDCVFAVMALAPQHTFQVLTKRSKRMREYMSSTSGVRSDGRGTAVLALGYKEPLELLRWPPPNVHLGVSAEDQTRADERIPDLLATPAAVRFVSAEPLLGPIDFTNITPEGSYEMDVLLGHDYDQNLPCERLDWIIVGGESGRGARPMHPDWARSIRDQCAAAGVPFFFKQWGEWAPDATAGPFLKFARDPDEELHGWPYDEAADSWRVGKHRAGRLLDSVEHNEMPA